LRLLQGLALGGEYGGAACYVAEHAPPGRRGFYTSWIQTTATFGLFLSLVVILLCRIWFGDQFEVKGWRVPFLVSILLLGISVYIRLQLKESPAFLEIKSQGQLSKAPLTEAFARWSNLKLVILALLGATAGQAVVWYGGQFYALFFLEKILQVDSKAANLIIAAGLLIGTPFFVVWGSVSDRIGRKTVVLAGLRARRGDLLPGVQGPDALRQPRSGSGGRFQSRCGRRRPERLLIPVRSHRQEDVQALLRRCQVSACQGWRAVCQRRRASGYRCTPADRYRCTGRVC